MQPVDARRPVPKGRRCREVAGAEEARRSGCASESAMVRICLQIVYKSACAAVCPAPQQTALRSFVRYLLFLVHGSEMVVVTAEVMVANMNTTARTP